jgi:hypothetical protein
MPCPLPLASSQNASSESKWPRVSFLPRIAPASERGFIPSIKRSDAIPHRLRSLIRATCFARASAPSTQSTRAAFQLAASCADSPAQYAVACRNRGAQLHFVPPASGRAPCSWTRQLRQGGDSSPPHKDRRSSAPLAQHHPRNMPCARKRAVQPNQTRAAFQLVTDCFP